MNKILLTLLFGCPLLSFAQSKSQQLVVWQKNGQKVYYAMDEEPRTTFEGSLLVISTSNIRVEYHRKDVLRFTFEGVVDGIEARESTDFGFRQKGDDISITGVQQGTQAQLYDMNGILLETQKSDGKGSLNFSLRGQNPGVYIVKLGEQALKFLKR